jgi:hypothetical protein
MIKSGCYTPYKKQTCIRKGAPERARTAQAPCNEARQIVRRVLWRQGRIIVYQHVNGQYLWADLDAHAQRSAIVRGDNA